MEIVRLLLKHGAKVEETNENGHTPLVSVSFVQKSIEGMDMIVSSDGSGRWRSC